MLKFYCWGNRSLVDVLCEFLWVFWVARGVVSLFLELFSVRQGLGGL